MPSFAARPRFPQKRRLPLIIVLLGTLALLLIAVISAQVFFDSSTNASAQLARGMAEGDTIITAEEYPSGHLPQELMFDKLLLEKGKHRLTAYSKGKPVRVYLVALGATPVGHKEYEGDMRTPEGEYTIDDKNPNSAYYKNIGISYPNRADIAHAEKLGKSPGGDIKIHGLAPDFAFVGPAHRVTDWTYGCVAVTNREMEEIYTRTAVGTPITIVP